MTTAVERPDLSEVVAFDAREHNHDPELFGKPVDRTPQLGCTTAFVDGLLRGRLWCGRPGVSQFPRRAAPVRAPPVDCQPPRHPNEPRPESIAIAKLRERAIRTREGLLRDVFSVFRMAEDAVGDPHRERRRLDQPRLEFLFERPVQAAYDAAAAGQPVHELMHAVSLLQDSTLRLRVHSGRKGRKGGTGRKART